MSSTALVRVQEKAPPLTHGHILQTRNIGVVRKPKQEPCEMEQLLILSTWGAQSDLDLSTIRGQQTRLSNTHKLTIEDCTRFEPGTVKYYVTQLPMRGDPRPLGHTSISTYWLTKGYDSLVEAMRAFDA